MDRDAHFQRLLLTHPMIKTKSHLSLKLPVKGAPLHVPPRVTQRREMLSLRRQWFILSLISLSPQLRSPSTKWRKNIRSPSKEPHVYNGLRPGSPKGIINDAAVSTPLPCSLQRYLPFWLGQTRGLLASVCHSTLNRVPLHTFYHLPHDPGYKST